MFIHNNDMIIIFNFVIKYNTKYETQNLAEESIEFGT